ncbi:hypothetical protein B4U80_12615, partial [Leptotrombidium deliense]
KAVNYNSKFKIVVKFKNPLNQDLKNCRVTVEGKGIKRKVVKLSNITAFATGNIALQLSSKYCGLETIVISLYTDILKEIVGHVQLQVKGKKRNVFAMFPRSNRKQPPFSESLPGKGEDTAFVQNQNHVTADLATCCTRVVF